MNRLSAQSAAQSGSGVSPLIIRNPRRDASATWPVSADGSTSSPQALLRAGRRPSKWDTSLCFPRVSVQRWMFDVDCSMFAILGRVRPSLLEGQRPRWPANQRHPERPPRRSRLYRSSSRRGPFDGSTSSPQTLLRAGRRLPPVLRSTAHCNLPTAHCNLPTAHCIPSLQTVQHLIRGNDFDSRGTLSASQPQCGYHLAPFQERSLCYPRHKIRSDSVRGGAFPCPLDLTD